MNKNEIYTNSVFEKKWWLDAVAEGKWELLSVKKSSGEISASFPIYKTKQFGFKLLSVPPLTQTLGLYIENTGAKLTKKLEREKKYINEIIKKLPAGYNCDFYLDVNNEYVLPFIWNGFKVEPKFSYRLEDLNDLDKVWSGFKENIKTDIRKAKKKVIVSEETDVDLLIQMQKKTFERQGRKLPFNEKLIHCIDESASENDAKLLLCARDSEGNLHAATYFVFDENRYYYLMSGGDPEYRNSGATSLLVWEGIKRASKQSNIFDFEGSMIEDIERFVRGFGARPRIYYHIQKKNWVLCLAEYMKPKIKKILRYK